MILQVFLRKRKKQEGIQNVGYPQVLATIEHFAALEVL